MCTQAKLTTDLMHSIQGWSRAAKIKKSSQEWAAVASEYERLGGLQSDDIHEPLDKKTISLVHSSRAAAGHGPARDPV